MLTNEQILLLSDCRTVLMRSEGALQGVLDVVESGEARDIIRSIKALVARIDASRVEPPANPSALKCPTCKRPMEEVKISELREYFEPPADPAESLREIIEQIVADGGADQNSDAYLGEEMLARIRAALTRQAEPTPPDAETISLDTASADPLACLHPVVMGDDGTGKKWCYTCGATL